MFGLSDGILTVAVVVIVGIDQVVPGREDLEADIVGPSTIMFGGPVYVAISILIIL